MVASAAVMAFVLVFSVNIYHSVSKMDSNFAYWGFDDADVLLNSSLLMFSVQIRPRNLECPINRLSDNNILHDNQFSVIYSEASSGTIKSVACIL
jgi:hypothetical protein